MIRAKKRNSLRKNQFGLPGSRKYPMDTKARAQNAKARATQQYNKGGLSKSALQRIRAKANKVIKRKKGK